jgi:hypothetical protein
MVRSELDRDTDHLIHEEGAHLPDEVHQSFAHAQSVEDLPRWRVTRLHAIAGALWSWFHDHADAYRFIQGRAQLVSVCHRAPGAIRAVCSS